jgi:hypothetical protein
MLLWDSRQSSAYAHCTPIDPGQHAKWGLPAGEEPSRAPSLMPEPLASALAQQLLTPDRGEWAFVNGVKDLGDEMVTAWTRHWHGCPLFRVGMLLPPQQL